MIKKDEKPCSDMKNEKKDALDYQQDYREQSQMYHEIHGIYPPNKTGGVLGVLGKPFKQ